ncbi:MAG: hypothetical protein SynsKO_31060 [Synoicihabitans sp.]
MNSTTTSRRRPSRRPVNLAPDLVWHHLGRAYRVSIWPEVAFEKEVSPGLWRTFTPDPRGDIFCAGAVMLDKRRWKAYLEFFPQSWQTLINRFSLHRLHALTALALCPALHEEFEDCPVLALLAASHAELRGSAPEWGELNAVGEMGSIYALLEWLGMPSTKEAFEQLQQIDLDIPLRDLRRVREILWQRHDASLRGKVTRINFSPLAA